MSYQEEQRKNTDQYIISAAFSGHLHIPLLPKEGIISWNDFKHLNGIRRKLCQCNCGYWDFPSLILFLLLLLPVGRSVGWLVDFYRYGGRFVDLKHRRSDQQWKQTSRDRLRLKQQQQQPSLYIASCVSNAITLAALVRYFSLMIENN